MKSTDSFDRTNGLYSICYQCKVSEAVIENKIWSLILSRTQKIQPKLLLNRLKKPKTPKARRFLEFWEQMKTKSFLNYNVDIKKQEEHIEDFKALSLKEQKQHLANYWTKTSYT